MKSPKSSRRKRIISLTLVPLLLMLSILGYHQLFYAPPKVDTGIARLNQVFRHHTADVWVVRFVPGHDWLASGSVDGTVKIWDRSSGRILHILKHPEGVTCFDISPDGTLVVTSSYDHKLRIWNLDDGNLIKELSGHSKTPWAVQFSPGGKSIVSGGEDAVVRLWDVATGALIKNLAGHTRTVWDVRFSPDGKTIASGSYDSKIKLWNAASGDLIKTLDGHTQAVCALAFSHDGKLLASGSDDKTIRLWNTADGSLIKTLEQPEHAQAVAFSPDDKRLLTGGRDKTMIGEFLQNFFGDSQYNKGVSSRLWDIESGAILQTFSVHANDANDVAFSPDGKWMASGSSDKTVALWEVAR